MFARIRRRSCRSLLSSNQVILAVLRPWSWSRRTLISSVTMVRCAGRRLQGWLKGETVILTSSATPTNGEPKKSGRCSEITYSRRCQKGDQLRAQDMGLGDLDARYMFSLRPCLCHVEAEYAMGPALLRLLYDVSWAFAWTRSTLSIVF